MIHLSGTIIEKGIDTWFAQDTRLRYVYLRDRTGLFHLLM